MVEERITDGKRIAQLLASELTGLERGPLGSVSVANADPDVEPTADGALAYRIDAGGETVGTVVVTPETARLEVRRATGVAVDRDDVTVTENGQAVVAHSGAAVKTLVDVVADALD